MKISIEKYRGYEIEFDTYAELFLSDVGNEGKESKTLSGAKKQVDDYIKQNATFVPFEVVHKSWNSLKKFTFSGIRKDKRFVDTEGKQFSEYDEKDCFVIELSLIEDVCKDIDLLQKAAEQAREYVSDAVKRRDKILEEKGVPLKQYKKELLERLGL